MTLEAKVEAEANLVDETDRINYANKPKPKRYPYIALAIAGGAVGIYLMKELHDVIENLGGLDWIISGGGLGGGF